MSIFLQKSPSWTLRTSFLFFLSLQLKAARTLRPRKEIKGNHILTCIIKLTYKSSHSKCISFMCYTESLHPFVFPVYFPFPSLFLLTLASCLLPPVSVFIHHMCGSLADQPVMGHTSTLPLAVGWHERDWGKRIWNWCPRLFPRASGGGLTTGPQLFQYPHSFHHHCWPWNECPPACCVLTWAFAYSSLFWVTCSYFLFVFNLHN